MQAEKLGRILLSSHFTGCEVNRNSRIDTIRDEASPFCLSSDESQIFAWCRQNSDLLVTQQARILSTLGKKRTLEKGEKASLRGCLCSFLISNFGVAD